MRLGTFLLQGRRDAWLPTYRRGARRAALDLKPSRRQPSLLPRPGQPLCAKGSRLSKGGRRDPARLMPTREHPAAVKLWCHFFGHPHTCSQLQVVDKPPQSTSLWPSGVGQAKAQRKRERAPCQPQSRPGCCFPSGRGPDANQAPAATQAQVPALKGRGRESDASGHLANPHGVSPRPSSPSALQGWRRRREEVRCGLSPNPAARGGVKPAALPGAGKAYFLWGQGPP